MGLRDDLISVLARDPRYPIEAYAFVFEALRFAEARRAKARATKAKRPKASKPPKVKVDSRHVSGVQLCEAARDLALRQYGLLAQAVLNHWGVRTTSDIGEIVYNLIAAKELVKTDADSRSDFDGVFEFEDAFGSAAAVTWEFAV